MSRARPFLLVLVIFLAVPCILWMGGGALDAQTRPSEVRPAYQYVGVEQTIARINLSTGRIELLAQRGFPKSSLLTDQQRPWRWREIRVRDSAGNSRDGVLKSSH